MKLFKNNNTQTLSLSKSKFEPKKRLVLTAEAKPNKNTVKDQLDLLGKEAKTEVCIYRGCGGVGDILMATPLLQIIKETFPNCKLTFAIDTKSAGDTYYNLVKNNPFIDEIVSAHTIKKDSYHIFKDISSVCIAYENSGLPWINRIDIFANACGFKLKDPKVFYKVEDKERIWATNFLSKIKNIEHSKIIMLHTASFDHKRTWPIHKYSEFISAYNNLDSSTIYLVNDFQHLNPYWSKLKNVVDISNYSIKEVAALTEQVDLFIGPDSGPMHIAGALNTPGIILFGSIPPEARINYYPSLEFYKTKGLACMPCYYRKCNFQVKCMTLINPTVIADLAYKKIHEII